MKHNFAHRIWHVRGMLLFILLFMLFSVPCMAAENTEGKVIRVAFPETAGFSVTDKDGERHGVVVDYLNEIAKYTGWKYEYIEVDSEALIPDFLDNKFDLMGGTYYAEDFEQYFAYPDYNCGYSRMVILARKDDTSIRSYDLSSLNGKNIGIYVKSTENIRRLKEWLTIQGLDCNIKYYAYEDLSEEGNLYRFLENGEVDLLVGNIANIAEEYYAAVSIDSQAHYIVTQPGNQEILDSLNMALAKIYEADPDFATKEYEANFSSISTTGYATLTEEDQEYIAQKETVIVAIPYIWHPMYCLNANDYHNGLVPDIINEVSDYSGLKFEYVTCDSYTEAIGLVQRGEADMLGFFIGDDNDALNHNLARTSTYVKISSILVRNKNVTYPSDNLVGGVLKGCDLPSDISAGEVVYYENATDALDAVNRGKIDFFYGLAPHVENIIRQQNFTNVVQVSMTEHSMNISFAMKSPVETELFTIINKAVNNLTDEEKNTISSRNVISLGDTHITFTSILYANPALVIAVITAFLILILAAVMLFYRSRLHSERMKLELDKAEAGSRAKSEFLSRMSHEIRTPMNAIVGLADLTEMIPGLPDKAQVNLAKIKTSSHYMLSLITDILDMSRIENGKMELDRAPFSIAVMICDIESMLNADAVRRGLDFRVESSFSDEVFVGDNIRLRQVILNLLSNAFKFTPEGGSVLLRITETSSTDVDGTLLIEVIDTGIGISEEHQKRVFRSFEQVGTNAARSQGTGLGLPISSSIVQLMGGTLVLKSEPGKGSEFSFYISMPKGELKEASAVNKESRRNMLQGVRILLAEDNDLNAEIAIELLQAQGAFVSRAENGRQAVKVFEDSPKGTFKVILMDIQMPEMNGLEAFHAIRSLPREDAKTVPVIAMTANTFKADVDMVLGAGMTGFISKPIDVEYLYSELCNALKC